jgi:hypothetical protein
MEEQSDLQVLIATEGRYQTVQMLMTTFCENVYPATQTYSTGGNNI